MDNEELGREVRRARTAARLTQTQVAGFMTRGGYKMHQTQIAGIESGAKVLTIWEANALFAILGLDIAETIGGVSGHAQTDEERAVRRARVELVEAETACFRLEQAADVAAAAAHGARARVKDGQRKLREAESALRRSQRTAALDRAESVAALLEVAGATGGGGGLDADTEKELLARVQERNAKGELT